LEDDEKIREWLTVRKIDAEKVGEFLQVEFSEIMLAEFNKADLGTAYPNSTFELI
jgi:hypothetical protein